MLWNLSCTNRIRTRRVMLVSLLLPLLFSSGLSPAIGNIPAVITNVEYQQLIRVGETEVFVIDWGDIDTISLRAMLCRSAVVDFAGSCVDGAWASGSYSCCGRSYVQFSPTVLDIGEHLFFAVVCSSLGECSAPYPGRFTVRSNSSPTLLAVSDNPDPSTRTSERRFRVQWSDPDGDPVDIYVCKTSVWANGCSDYWASMGAEATENPAHALMYGHVFFDADLGKPFDYWVRVCDIPNSCSAMVYGGTFVLAATTSTPSVYLMRHSPDQTLPGSVVTFRVEWTDSEWTSGSDMWSVHICKTASLATSAGNYYCPGGHWTTSAMSASATPTRLLQYQTTIDDQGWNQYYTYVVDAAGHVSIATGDAFKVNDVL